MITGGAGFIGSHLADEMLKSGCEVVIIDDLSTGSILNIEHLKTNPDFHYIIDSVFNVSLMAELVDASDLIFHLAAAVGVRLIVESPVRTIETNIKGTEILLDLAAKKAKRLLITSTSEVYGKNSKTPFTEQDDLVLGATTRPRWSYACSKAIDEFLALAYHREKKLPITIVRLFNTVGPRQTGQYGMVIPRFVTQALANKPITVYGDGSQQRCFAFVKDVVKSMALLMESDKAIGEVFNIGSNNEISILELAERVKQKCQSGSEIIFLPYDKAYDRDFEDMQRRVPDTSKLKNTIGFAPNVGIDQILDSIIELTLSRTKI